MSAGTYQKDELIMNIHQKIAKLRADKRLANIKKSGHNKFANFKYFELADFLPLVIEIENELGLISDFNLTNEVATLTVINAEKEDAVKVYTSPVAEVNAKGMLEIQKLGSQHTYIKRYLYLNYLNLTENDTVDSIKQDPAPKKVEPKKVTEKEQIKTNYDKLITLLYDKDERKEAMLGHYGVKKVEDLTPEQVVEAIEILTK